MRLLRRVGNLLAYVRRHGLLTTARYVIERAAESYHEWRLGIRTVGKVTTEELGIDNPYSAHYYPSDYRSIYRALCRLRIRPHKDVFLDYGCGMGRVLVVAGTFPFRRVIGVELSPTLSEAARQNLRRARKKLRCGEAEVVTTDAAEFQVPADVTFVFFYNPFHGPVLTSALGSLRASLKKAPRRAWVVFKNMTYLEPLLMDHTWLVKREEFPACDGDHKIAILEAQI
jgi:SAM-dependent methyltransferase